MAELIVSESRYTKPHSYFIDEQTRQQYYIVIDTVTSNDTYSKFALLNKNFILVSNNCYDMKLKTFELLYNMNYPLFYGK
jgi:hypothetical protein